MVPDQQNSCHLSEYAPHELDNLLHKHIKDYVENNSFVKLEASLTEMIYQQFKDYYYSANELEQKQIENEIDHHIPDRVAIKHYLAGNSLSFQKINTIANFFGLEFNLRSHDPVTLYQQKKQIRPKV